MSNILFTTLSLTNGWNENIYYKNGRYCVCVQQQEQGAKYFLSTQKIDKIVIFGTMETLEDADKSSLFRDFAAFDDVTLPGDWKQKEQQPREELAKLSAFEKLMVRLASFLCPDDADISLQQKAIAEKTGVRRDSIQMMRSRQPYGLEIPVVFVPNIDENDADNIDGLMKALTGTQEDPTYVYMDMQGGTRTKIYVNNAVLQMLTEFGDVYHTNLTQVVATNFTDRKPMHEIVDETDQYKIIELVSGMTAFLKYGHADVIAKYLQSLQQNDAHVQQLVDAMYEIDQAITYSRINNEDEKAPETDLVAAVSHLNKAVNSFPVDSNYPSYVKKIFGILIEAITQDYGQLLDGEDIDVLAVIDWCLRKNHLFTALTVAETKIPSYLVHEGILFYAKNETELTRVKDYFTYQYMKEDKKNLNRFADINHYFIRDYLKTMGFFFSKKEEPQPREFKSAYYFREMLCNPSAFPVRVYTGTEDMTTTNCNKRFGLISEIMLLFEFLAINGRNPLAHPNRNGISDKTIRTIKARVSELLRKIRQAKVISSPTQYYLDDRELRKCTKDDINSAWNRIIQYEIEDTSDFGSLTEIINNKSDGVKKGYYIELFGLGSLMPAWIQLRSIWNTIRDTGNPEKQISNMAMFLKTKKAEAFSEMMIAYYNLQHPGETPLSLAGVNSKDYNKTTDATASDTDVKSRIESMIKREFDSGLRALRDHLESQETWSIFWNKIKSTIQNEYDQKGMDRQTEENRNMLISVFATLGIGNTPAWRPVLQNMLQNDPARFRELLGVEW